MAKVTVYVPNDLKARMDALGEPNWSSTAQEAFLHVIRNEEWKMVTDEIEQAVLRLQASKKKYCMDEEEYGKVDGREWALKEASYEELAKLRSLIDNESMCEWSMWEVAMELQRRDGSGFCWDSDHLSDSYVEGFVDGAVAVFDDVKDKL